MENAPQLERALAIGRLSGANVEQMDNLLTNARVKRDVARASKDPADTAKLDAEIGALPA